MTSAERSAFTAAELAFLDSRDTGHIATVDAAGQPNLTPVSYVYNALRDTIDVTGQGMADSDEFRDVHATGRAAFVTDDIEPPWRPRSVDIRGPAEALTPGAGALIRIRPERISSRGLDSMPVRRTRRSDTEIGRGC